MDNERMFEQIIALVKAIYKTEGTEGTQRIIETKATELLAPVGVGKWCRKFFSPATVAIREDINVEREFVISGEEIDESIMFGRKFDSPNGGLLSFEFYPVKGVKWTDEDRELFDFLCEFFFILYGRGHLYSVYEKANFYDGLTGVPNRAFFLRAIVEHVAEGNVNEYLGGIANIKNFRRINDRYGAGGGDRYLVNFSNCFLSCIEKDECFCRLGGDNFAFFVKTSRYKEFEQAIQSISFKLQIGDEIIEFTPKLRVGLYQMKQGDGFHQLMQAINEAYQIAKLPESPDYVWYQPYMLERGHRAREVADDFIGALERGEFVAFYQPKVLLETKTLCGAEALCRWIKDGHVVPPMEFIPILEKDGSITKLDFYMLERVCKDIAEWKRQGLIPGRISINFSKHHLHNERLGEKIIDILDRYGIEHEYIEIELTEQSGHDDYDDMRRFVAYMKSQDVATSVDDFGTGYSSLNMLTSVCADIIKLDKSFLDDINEKPLTHRNMVKNIINMINELCMDTVAEGVETMEQARLLETWECKIVQGYLFDKPLPLSEFTKRLESPQYEL